MIMVPSSFIAVLIGAASVAWRGKELSEDPEYLRRLEAGEIIDEEPDSGPASEVLSRARGSAILFLAGVLLVVLIGIFLAILMFGEFYAWKKGDLRWQ